MSYIRSVCIAGAVTLSLLVTGCGDSNSTSKTSSSASLPEASQASGAGEPDAAVLNGEPGQSSETASTHTTESEFPCSLVSNETYEAFFGGPVNYRPVHESLKPYCEVDAQNGGGYVSIDVVDVPPDFSVSDLEDAGSFMQNYKVISTGLGGYVGTLPGQDGAAWVIKPERKAEIGFVYTVGGEQGVAAQGQKAVAKALKNMADEATANFTDQDFAAW